ncbi:hypothetical protein Tco_0719534 [Tanacetum coccineum]
MLILRLTTRGGRSKTHPLPKSGVSGDGGGWLRQEVSRPFLGGSDMDGSSRIDILAVHTVYRLDKSGRSWVLLLLILVLVLILIIIIFPISCVSLLDPLRDSLSSASGSDSGTYPGESAVGEAASSR